MKIKSYMLALLMLITTSSFAADAICLVKTNLESDEQYIAIELTDQGHGPMEYFFTEKFNGLLSSSKGSIVVGLSTKDTGVSMSFHGKVSDGPVGGQFISGDDWIQVSCQ